LSRVKQIIVFSLVAILSCVVLICCRTNLLKKKVVTEQNVILITVDALRADHMSCYGYKRKTTPFLDKFCRDAAVFTQAVAHSSHTPVSVGSIAAGCYVTKHGLRTWGDNLKSVYNTLPIFFKTNDYTTLFISSNKGLHGFFDYVDIFNRTPAEVERIFDIAVSHIDEIENKFFYGFIIWEFIIHALHEKTI
jgi:glucan phosphoethanolaminetransferase (alkaline phosphatase superfamily)